MTDPDADPNVYLHNALPSWMSEILDRIPEEERANIEAAFPAGLWTGHPTVTIEHPFSLSDAAKLADDIEWAKKVIGDD